MAGGPPISPYYYEDRDASGTVVCAFDVYFDASQNLTSVQAYNAQGDGLTEIQVTRSDGVIKTFPLPNSGKKTTLGVTDPQGNPTTISVYSATISQSQINSQGFFVLSDLAGYTVF